MEMTTEVLPTTTTTTTTTAEGLYTDIKSCPNRKAILYVYICFTGS